MIYITQYHEYFERKKKLRARINISLLSPFISTAVSTIPEYFFLPEKGKVKKKKKRILPAANSSSAPTIPSRSPQPPVSVTRNKLPLSR